jgi:excisionase family DNA binding protein
MALCQARRHTRDMTDHRHSSARHSAALAAALARRDASDIAIDPRTLGFVTATYGVNETLELLSIGRTALYEAVKRGEVTPTKLGRKMLFSAADLAAFVVGLVEATSDFRIASDPSDSIEPRRRPRRS